MADKVGIGTASPSQALDVRSTTNTDGIAINIYENTSVVKGRAKGSLFFKYENPGEYQNPVLQTGAEIRTDAGKDYDDAASSSGDTDLVFLTARRESYSLNLAEKMRIRYDGKVGIGTASPGEQLEVNGNVKATRIATGTGTSAPSDDAPIGSLYVDTSANRLYVKMTSGTGSDKWKYASLT